MANHTHERDSRDLCSICGVKLCTKDQGGASIGKCTRVEGHRGECRPEEVEEVKSVH